MAQNPLFMGDLPAPDKHEPAHDSGLDPFAPEPKERHKGSHSAAELIRGKLDRLYAKEPSAREEIREAAVAVPRSKHQEYMFQLSNSGKSLAEIQTEWHRYYEQLPDDEKHAVWQEFYAEHERAKQASTIPAAAQPADDGPIAPPQVSGVVTAAHHPVDLPVVADHDRRGAHSIADNVRHTARTQEKRRLTAKHHIQAIAFGLAAGSMALVITLFSFFNEVVIAPFIQPSRTASATPIIIGTGDQVASGGPKVIIPKINVEIPLSFDAKTTDDATIEEALDTGVVHYPTTALPGQNGNAAFFGHSSNNLFNKGKYKFAFVLLHQLVAGDTFYLTYDGKVYAYQVFDKKVVPPSQVDVLNPVEGQTATATLITCDPPGTSINRLVVWGKQVSPSVDSNVASNQQSVTASNPAAGASDKAGLPGNGPTLWGRIVNWFKAIFS